MADQHLTHRWELAAYSTQDIIAADKDLLLGATDEFDGVFLPEAKLAKPNQLVAMMSDEQVEAILKYLGHENKD